MKMILRFIQIRNLLPGEGIIAGFLVGMAFVACDRILAVLLLVLAFTTNGLQASGQQVNHLDIAPVYAGEIDYENVPGLSRAVIGRSSS